jgi:hypothetical protein
MSRRLSLTLGGILFAVGVLWTLQGLDLVGGSSMSGVRVWAVVGPFVALIGLVVAFGARRRRP